MSATDDRAEIVTAAIRAVGPGAAATVAAAYDAGTGTCNAPLGAGGQCPRASDHLTPEGTTA